MSRADEARQRQRAFEAEQIATARPGERARGPLDPADPRGPHFWPCSARLGRRHDLSMKRPGGGYACWTCGKTKQQLLAERATEAA